MYLAHYEDALRFVRRRAHPMNVEDVVGETFLAAWRRRRELPEDARPWLFGTARNLMLNANRGMRRQCLDATDLNGTGADPVISNADLRGKVASMVVTRGDVSAYCLAGSDGGDEELNSVVGWAGSDVEGITVRDHGHTIEATIQGGRFTAWWPDGDPDGTLPRTWPAVRRAR